MTLFLRVSAIAAATLLISAGLPGCGSRSSAQNQPTTGTETIVVMRHGEKASQGVGQLNCTGLNRSLALPAVLIGRFGKATAIFAPSPAAQISENGTDYSYVRPLATIEPTAIQLGLPVNTQIGYTDIAQLQQTVTESQYAASTVFIAWEHGNAYQFAQNLLTTYGQDASTVPSWSDGDYDMLYVFKITTASGQQPTLSFSAQQEGLTGTLPSTCPTLASVSAGRSPAS